MVSLLLLIDFYFRWYDVYPIEALITGYPLFLILEPAKFSSRFHSFLPHMKQHPYIVALQLHPLMLPNGPQSISMRTMWLILHRVFFGTSYYP
jgi:hypothetical protein